MFYKKAINKSKSILLLSITFTVLVSCKQVSDNKVKSVISSNLPIVLVDTYGKEILNDPKIPSQITVFNDLYSDKNFINESSGNEFFAGIELRGFVSLNLQKKSYGFEIWDKNKNDLSLPLLGIPKESDWILYGPYSDKTLIRNHLAFSLVRQMGNYASQTRFVELYIKEYDTLDNSNIEYQGIYVLMEKIKRSKSRINIAKIGDKDKDLSGGYILEMIPSKRLDSSRTYLQSKITSKYFELIYPKSEKATEDQNSWILEYLENFEYELINENFDPDNGYQKFVDLDNIVDYVLINEFARNLDAFHASTYLYKDKNGKLKFGPPWDFNYAFGNFRRTNPEKPGVLNFDNMWIKALLKDNNFRNKFRDRYYELRKSVLNIENINSIIDESLATLGESKPRNFKKWNILGKRVWPNPKPVPPNYKMEILSLRQWIERRCIWMDQYMESFTTIQ